MNKSLIGLALAASAAAISLSTSTTALALPHPQGFAAAAAPAGFSAPHADGDGRGSVIATVPVASIGPLDSSASQLQSGRSYLDNVLIWVAPSAHSATVQVKAAGVAALHCSSAKLHVGAVNLVGCEFKTTAEPPRATTISITVDVDVDGDRSISHSFVHDIKS